ncbi:hypothetical protein [Actinomadura rubrisoli]|uniref:Chromosome segregation ATPase n=1 Tax=Actinomadura rubrisoli TaxID=2530368 RepID=A0A4R5BVJ4_9ACTN|nr:hypothetical protein [Actinomadura rubrisoli]TDD91131.1 hypothetical protein E1298_12170 [Actinomadura rubrisoli]
MIEDEVGETATAPSPNPETGTGAARKPRARCEWCQQPLPPPRNPRRGGRPQRYHQVGEGPDGQNCKALADAARKTATAAATAEPLAGLRAFAERAAAERAAFADRLDQHLAVLKDLTALEREGADRLTEVVDAVTARNAELERQAADARAAATEAEAAREQAERREEAAVGARAAAERERDQAQAAAAAADTRAQLAEELATTHELARRQAEKETRSAAEGRAEARAERDTARAELADAEQRLRRDQDELTRVRTLLEHERTRREALAEQATAADTRARASAERAEHAERDAATVRRRLAAAETTARTAREAADAARTELAAERAARRAETAALIRDRDAARDAADTQRERAALAQQRAETAEAAAPPAARLPAVDDTGTLPTVRIDESAAIRAEHDGVLLDRLPTRLPAQTALQVAHAILALHAHQPAPQADTQDASETSRS